MGLIRKIERPELDSPPSFKAYLHWEAQRDRSEEITFWKSWMKDFQTPQLIGTNSKSSTEAERYLVQKVQIEEDEITEMRALCSQLGVSLNTLIQGFWGLLLGKWFESNDVVFGLTVSGRTNDFPGIELLAYPLTNLIPARIRFEETDKLSTWLKGLQVQYGSLGPFESTPLSEIQSWMNWSGNSPLFDCLVVFQGLPWKEFKAGGLTLRDLQGKTTSVYPLSLLINSQGTLTFTFRYDPKKVPQTFISWASSQIPLLFSRLGEKEERPLTELLSPLESPPKSSSSTISSKKTSVSTAPSSEMAASAMEVLLTQIWERTLGIDQIGPEDDFFGIGGTSIMAVQVFGEIEKQLGKSLAPTHLMTHPTIRSLSNLLQDEVQEHWASLVSIQPKGNKPPLFVIHDIGGDIFIYKELAQILGKDQPLFGFQAKGLDGKDSTLSSISDLAVYYVEEILRLFPDGPFLIAGISFGGILAYEMGQKLLEFGKDPDLLILFDTYPNPGKFSYGQNGVPKGYKRLSKIDKHVGRLLIEGGRARAKHYLSKTAKVLLTKLPFITYKERIPPERNVRIWDANERAVNDYFMEPINCRLTLFLADQNYSRFYEDTRLGWSEYALKGLEIHVVPGNHLSIMYPPNVKILAEKLKVCINRVEEERKKRILVNNP